MYCVNATREVVQRMQMSFDGRTVRERSRQGVSVAIRRNIPDVQGSVGEKGVINRNLCKHIIEAETR